VLAYENIFKYRQAPEELDILKGPGHASGYELVDLLSLDLFLFIENPARAGSVDPGNGIEKRRLTGSVGADDGVDGLRLDFERNIVERLDSPERLGYGFNL
jgi:hypothetical protein